MIALGNIPKNVFLCFCNLLCIAYSVLLYSADPFLCSSFGVVDRIIRILIIMILFIPLLGGMLPSGIL